MLKPRIHFYRANCKALVFRETEAEDSHRPCGNFPSTLPLPSCFLNQGLRVSHRVERCIAVQLSHGSPGTSPGMVGSHRWEDFPPFPKGVACLGPHSTSQREGQCEVIFAPGREQVGQGTPPVPISSLIPFIITLY